MSFGIQYSCGQIRGAETTTTTTMTTSEKSQKQQEQLAQQQQRNEKIMSKSKCFGSSSSRLFWMMISTGLTCLVIVFQSSMLTIPTTQRLYYQQPQQQQQQQQLSLPSLMMLVEPSSSSSPLSLLTSLSSSSSIETVHQPNENNDQNNHYELSEEDEEGDSEHAANDSDFYIEESSKKPYIVWLVSYPNSGTSYTMTMIEEATNLSTATNYGVEVSTKNSKDNALPIYMNHPEGPYWHGMDNNDDQQQIITSSSSESSSSSASKKGITNRKLPDTFILTKTHCGGRCIKCNSSEYVVKSTNEFLQYCERTTAYHDGHRIEQSMDSIHTVAKMIHLIRNPFHNIIARFHLERRHIIEKYRKNDIRMKKKQHEQEFHQANQTQLSLVSTEYVGLIDGDVPSLADDEILPNNVTGFRRWCHYLDTKYWDDDDNIGLSSSSSNSNNASTSTSSNSPLPSKVRSLMMDIPYCRAEFYKYVQWHNLIPKVALEIGNQKQKDRYYSGNNNSQRITPSSSSSLINDDDPEGDDDELEEHDYDTPHVGGVPVLTVYYEDYHTKLYHTADQITSFLEQPIVVDSLRLFRSLPDYNDHYTEKDRKTIRDLMYEVATTETWKKIEHYF